MARIKRRLRSRHSRTDHGTSLANVRSSRSLPSSGRAASKRRREEERGDSRRGDQLGAERNATESHYNRKNYSLSHVILSHHVLPRLPVVTLFRMRAVCKAWNDYIHCPAFVASADCPRGSFLLTYHKQRLAFYDDDVDAWRSVPIPFPIPDDVQTDGSVLLLHSCNGLLCLLIRDERANTAVFRVWNLVNNTWQDLPPITSGNPSISSWNRWQVLHGTDVELDESNGFQYIEFREKSVKLLFVRIATSPDRRSFDVSIGTLMQPNYVMQPELNGSQFSECMYSSLTNAWTSRNANFPDNPRSSVLRRSQHTEACLPNAVVLEDGTIVMGTEEVPKLDPSRHPPSYLSEAGIRTYHPSRGWEHLHTEPAFNLPGLQPMLNPQPPEELVLSGTSVYCCDRHVLVGPPVFFPHGFQIWKADMVNKTWELESEMPQECVSEFDNHPWLKIVATNKLISFTNPDGFFLIYNMECRRWRTPPQHPDYRWENHKSFDVSILNLSLNACVLSHRRGGGEETKTRHGL